MKLQQSNKMKLVHIERREKGGRGKKGERKEGRKERSSSKVKERGARIRDTYLLPWSEPKATFPRSRAKMREGEVGGEGKERKEKGGGRRREEEGGGGRRRGEEGEKGEEGREGEEGKE